MKQVEKGRLEFEVSTYEIEIEYIIRANPTACSWIYLVSQCVTLALLRSAQTNPALIRWMHRAKRCIT